MFSQGSGLESGAGAAPPQSGFAFWAQEVLERWERAGSLEEAEVHDLRVAIRRCRSMAEGLGELDPHRNWQRFEREGRRLFKRLGALRDVQVMQIWIARLAPPDDPVGAVLRESLQTQEASLKERAAVAMVKFNRKKWAKLAEKLTRRGSRFPEGSLVFEHQALERWKEAYKLHRLATRDRTKAAWHRLRIGLKKFRYSVENFLPDLYPAWKKGLKLLQDSLGDIHDLDVLWAALPSTGPVFDQQARQQWCRRVETERTKRLADYRDWMMGPKSLWAVWRAELPNGPRLEEASLARLAAWASGSGRQLMLNGSLERLAVRLYDEMGSTLSTPPFNDSRWRMLLRAAAIAASAKGGKSAAKKIRRMRLPLGWTREDAKTVADTLRSLKSDDPQKLRMRLALRSLTEQKAILIAAGILRLALELNRYGVKSENVSAVGAEQGGITLSLGGCEYSDQAFLGAGAKKSLLEWACDTPIVLQMR